MVLFWITLVLALSGSNAEGEFCILHSPDSLKFKPSGATWQSTLKEIFAAALGLTVPYDVDWDGLEIINPFNTPEAVVVVDIDGVSSLGENNGLNSKIFPLLVDDYDPDTFRSVMLRIKQRFDNGGNEVVNFELSDATDFNRIKTVFGKVDGASYKHLEQPLTDLKPGVLEDRLFLKELRTLQAVIEKVHDGVLSPDKLIDFYNFRFRTLHTLSDYYGPISNQTIEAMKLLGDTLQELNKAFVKAYDGSVLVTVVTTEVPHSRRSARAVTTKPLGHSKNWPYKYMGLEKQQPNKKKQSKVAQTGGKLESDVEVEGRRTESTPKSPDKSSPEPQRFAADDATEPGTDPLPFVHRLADAKEEEDELKKASEPENNSAIFNLFLHIGLGWFFTMLAIVYVLMDMDPGRDTIIYRMTAPRLSKKDV